MAFTNEPKSTSTYAEESKNVSTYSRDPLKRGTVFFVSEVEDFYLVGENEDLFLIAQVYAEPVYDYELKN